MTVIRTIVEHLDDFGCAIFHAVVTSLKYGHSSEQAATFFVHG